MDLADRPRTALSLAGAAGAALWAAQQPLDQRIARHGYDDLAILGKAVTRGRHWRSVGLAAHVVNGALFGLAYSEVLRRTPRMPAHASAQAMAQAENFGLFPLTSLVDRHHPARDELPQLWFAPRALAQATWRHAILGLVIGEAGRRLRRRARDVASPIHWDTLNDARP